MALCWRVIGGADKGGILVRQGEGLKSAAEDARLSTGAVIEQLELKGQRLQYKLVSGSGPAEGWVSTVLKDKELVLPEFEFMRFPRMYFGTPVPTQTYKDFADDYFKRLKNGETLIGDPATYGARRRAGEIKGGAPGKPPAKEGDYVDAAFEERRQLVEENVAKVVESLEKYKHPPPHQKLTKQQLEKEAPKMIAGDSYGLDVPPNLDALEKLGADWLTQAFHAAGTLPKDNEVKKITKFKRLPMTTKDAAGGAGAKAFLTVEYESPDPELHTELFVKLPWDTVGTKETGGDALWRFKISALPGDIEYQECTVYHFLGPILPFKIPKWYFADICRKNTNYILITEKLLFGGSAEYLEGKKKKSFEPYEIQPVAEKYFDFERPPRMRYEMYYATLRAVARMAAWDQLNKFDFIPAQIRGAAWANGPYVGDFEFPMKVPSKKRGMLERVGSTCWNLMSELVCDKGKHCFPQEYRQEAFLASLQKAIVTACTYKDDVLAYNVMFPEKMCMIHGNLQSDNAYFWYNDNDEIDCGIIDWGGCGPSQIYIFFQGCLTSCEGDVLVEHELNMLRCFAEEFYRECGMEMHLGELYRMWHIARCHNAANYSLNIEQEIFREVPKEKWGQINRIEHSLILDNWNTRCYMYMIRSCIKYFYTHWTKSGRNVPLDALEEWVDYWKKKGME